MIRPVKERVRELSTTMKGSTVRLQDLTPGLLLVQFPQYPHCQRKGGGMQHDRPTMSPKEAAALLALSEDTVVRWFSLGTIEGYRKTPSARGRIRLYRDSVEAFDRQRKSQVPPRKQ